MKITNSIGFFLIIFFTFLIYWLLQTKDMNEIAEANHKYDVALTTAVEDAAHALTLTASPQNEFSYKSKKYSNLNLENAYSTFLKSSMLNFGVQTDNTVNALEYYVPIFGVIGYDGYTSNRFEQVGSNLIRIWQPMQPYTMVDASGNIIRFTLDDYVYVYDRASFDRPEWIEGPRKKLVKEMGSLVPVLQNEQEFEERRRYTIVSQIEKAIETELNIHNQVLSSKGYTYKFALPLITEETWDNTIDDVGIVAFIQGYPIHRLNIEYNQYAFATSRLVKKDSIYATTLDTGERVFWSASCNFNYPKTESYSSKSQAAKSGYKELSCLNQ